MYDLIVLIVLLTIGYVVGRFAETRHYRSIIAREEALRGIPAVTTKLLPTMDPPARTTLVAGNVVISVDYFKKFVAGLRNLAGGRVVAYETLVDRARREAILRMKFDAKRRGAKMVFNVKLETSSISKGRKNSIGSLEVLAYGTAVVPAA
jgi:uncharacterized protein YbjQ (UPF0145 family)